MIAFYSPRVINWVSATISILIEKIRDKNYRKKIVRKIYMRFRSIPNTGLLDIWIQRITEPQGISFDYPDKLAKLAMGTIKNSELWNCSWLVNEAKSLINAAQISDLDERLKSKTISPIISREEVELFKQDYF